MSTRDDDDFAREIESHLELEADRLAAEGHSREAARDAARRAFGNVTAARERFHDASRWVWLEQLGQDLRYGCRTLLHSPSFAATTILTLAIGLALTTGVFTVFNAYVLRAFAVRDPGNLHQVVWHARDAAGRNLRWRDFEAIRDRRDVFTDALAESTRYVSSKGRPLAAELVSGNYFAMLGPDMFLGRPLDPADDRGNAVVLSYQAWAVLFARDRSAIGRDIDLNGRQWVLVGVLGPRFSGLHGMPRDIWIPLSAYAAVSAPDLLADEARAIDVSVRLRDGVTPQQAQSAITPLVEQAAGRDRQAWAEIRLQDRPAPLTLGLLALLSPVFAAFALVLFAGCANVSSVMLARAVSRQREIAVRLSLGAGRGRIVRQLLTEGLLIALMAAAVSIVLTAIGIQVATAIFFGTLPPTLAAILRTAPLAIDHRVYLFALAAAVLSTLAFALLPALQASRLALTGALGAHGSGGQRGSRLRAALVAGQVAISLLLVVPALTLARNGVMIRSVDVGCDIADVISINVREGDDVALARRLSEVMASEPRVQRFALSNGNPLFGPPRKVILESQGTRVPTPFNFVSPEYFATLRIPMTRGRGFRADEARTEARVAIVSGATARAFWPGQDPIGKTVRIASANERQGDVFGGYSEVTIVGTCADVISGLIVDGPEAGHIYLPTSAGHRHATSMLARARSPQDLAPEPLQGILKRAAIDPEVFEALPLEEVRTLQVYPFMAASWIGSVLGFIALVLSISGLFGVLTYTLTQRSREIGIRIALGATAGAVVRLVMRQTAWLTGLGAVVGLAGAFALLKILGTVVRLAAVSLLDGVAFGAGLALVVAAAAIAAYQPARRAARVDPALTLRADG
jgi:predicted permease